MILNASVGAFTAGKLAVISGTGKPLVAPSPLPFILARSLSFPFSLHRPLSCVSSFSCFLQLSVLSSSPGAHPLFLISTPQSISQSINFLPSLPPLFLPPPSVIGFGSRRLSEWRFFGPALVAKFSIPSFAFDHPNSQARDQNALETNLLLFFSHLLRCKPSLHRALAVAHQILSATPAAAWSVQSTSLCLIFLGLRKREGNSCP